MIIGIPVYKDIDGFKRMMETFLASTTETKYNIIIVESETPGIQEICDTYFISQLPNETSLQIYHTKKEGPLKAYELLFNIAKERKEDLFLTQTDVIFPELYGRNWLKEMQEISKRENCGMITCLGGGGISGPDFIDGFKWVGAWILYIPYRVIEKLGGYDMNIPLGWGVDIDYTYAVVSLGYNIYQINYWVQHYPNYEEAHEHEKVNDIENLKKEAYRYMREKWKVGEYKK
jgi:hypothetical protein